MSPGVGKIFKIMKIGKKLENGLGVVGGPPDRCKMISAIIGRFLDGFWPRIHLKTVKNMTFHDFLSVWGPRPPPPPPPPPRDIPKRNRLWGWMPN